MPTRFLPLLIILMLMASFAVPVRADDRLSTSAEAAFADGNYAAALDLYVRLRDTVGKESSKDEKRLEEWARLAAQVVRCQTGQGNFEQAVQEYFLMCQVVPPSKTPLDCIPLPWFIPVDIKVGFRPHEKTAIDRLDPLRFKSPGAPATLLAAAVLAVSADNGRRNRGISLLRNLESQYDGAWMPDEVPKTPEARITAVQQQAALLATAFLWKQRIPNIRQSADLLPLRRTLDRLPEPLRAGPYYLYGIASRQAGDYEMAVMAWMRLPILHPQESVLRTESLREAAISLEKLGRADQAEKLRLEAGLVP